MGNLDRFRPKALRGMQRDVEDAAEDYDMPRRFHGQLARVFDDDHSPRSLENELERLLSEFDSPPSLRQRVARLFDEHRRGGSDRMRAFVPDLDVFERDDEYHLRIDLPGVRARDIDVHVDSDGVLTLSGRREDEAHGHEHGYEHTERSLGTFSRSVQLPRTADTSRIETDLRDGVLDVCVPKRAMAGREQRFVGGRATGNVRADAMDRGLVDRFPRASAVSRMEGRERIDRSERDRSERVGLTDRGYRTDRLDRMDRADAMDRADHMGRIDSADRTGRIEEPRVFPPGESSRTREERETRERGERTSTSVTGQRSS